MYINGIQWPYHPIHMASIFFTYINILLYNYIYILYGMIFAHGQNCPVDLCECTRLVCVFLGFMNA